MSNIKKLLGEKIRFLRNKNGITQETFAEMVGISPRSVSFIENGKNYPSAETLALICEILKIEPYKLFIFQKQKSLNEIKNALIDKISNDDDFALFVYDYVKEVI